MAYGLEYRSEWAMMDGLNTVRVSIFDTDTLTDDPPTIVNLTPSGNPLLISIIDNDKNKYKAIKSRQAKIEVLTSSEIGFETFADAADNRYYVEVRLNPDTTNKGLFFGYLSLADNSEDFLPDPNILVLTATDHLGMLKDIPLTTGAGLNPTGKSKMIDYLSWALRKTGLNLQIMAVNNLRHGTTSLTIGASGGPTQATFSFAGQYIVIDAITSFFYVGQSITISGTTSNNGSVTVTNVDTSSPSVTVVYIDAPIVSESATSCVFTDDTSDEYFYNHYLDAKTFEAEIGACEDCYTVIEKILGYDCFVTQYNGQWWIFRIDEWDSNSIYVTEYDYLGEFVSFHSPTNYNIFIGRDEDIKPYLADWRLSAERPHGEVKLVFNYENPKEIPCNVDFERGDLIGDDGTEEVEEVTYTRKKYELDCWESYFSGPSGDEPATVDIEVKRLFNELGYEDSRYINIPPTSGEFTFIMSEGMTVEAGDKFELSVTRRIDGNPGGTGTYRDPSLQIRLYGDDGTYWTCRGGNTLSSSPKVWTQCDATFTTDQRHFWFEGLLEDDQREPVSTYDSDGLPFPVSGVVKICVFQSSLWGGTYATKIDKIDFTYYPRINGAYQKYSGQHQKVTRNPEDYLAKLDETVYVSDSPKPLLKGGIFRQIDADTFKLCKVWYPYNVFPSGLSGSYDSAHPYGEVQIRSVFNQYRDAYRIFVGSINGLTEDWPDLIHKYSILDVNPNTNNRYFMLSSFEQNWKTGLMSGVWMEVWRSPGKAYTEDREFKYISQ